MNSLVSTTSSAMNFILGASISLLLISCSEREAERNSEIKKEVTEPENQTSQHSHKDLEHFQMGEMTFVDLDLEGSVQKLLSDYQMICDETSIEPLDLSAVVLITSSAKQTISLRGSFTHILAQLSLIHGAEIETSETNTPSHAGKYTFYATTKGGERRTLTLPTPKVQDQLPALGRIFHSHLYLSSTESLIVANGIESDLKRFREFIRNRELRYSIQIKTNAKLLSIPSEGISDELSEQLENSQNLTEKTAQELLDQIASIADADIMPLPIILSRLGEAASLNLTHQLELHQDNQILATEPHHWVGYSLYLRAQGLGFNIITDLQYANQAVGDFDGMKMEPGTKAMIDSQNTINAYTAANLSMIGNGNVSMIKIKPDGGKYNYLMLNQKMIDHTKRYDHSRHPARRHQKALTL